jgi:hypothetical protein
LFARLWEPARTSQWSESCRFQPLASCPEWLISLGTKTLRDNEVFAGVISDLIVPSLRNKEEPALREQGLICLALCCMIEVVSQG